MRSLAIIALGLLAAAPAAAQTVPTPLPQAHIPPPVLLELRALETRFDQALAGDCAPEKCFSKGCVYGEHAAVDMPRSGSLPGLAAEQGPGSVPVQEYLTQARCEFTHEKSVSNRDVAALVKRLEQRLSKGWLKVTVTRQLLEPVSEGLRESPKPPEPPPPPPPPVVEEKKPEPPPPPPKWDAEVARRELWLALLPHFSWMIAVVLATLAALMIIWALRRLGRETVEEKAMLAQLESGALAKDAESKSAAEAEAEAGAEARNAADPQPDDAAAIAEQQRMWNERIGQAELSRDEGMVVELLRDWLRAGEFALLAKAILLFGDRLSVAFPADGEYAVRKVELAEYLKNLDEKALPSDEEFFRKLNQHSISSSLLAQADAEIYRSLREEFGPTGLVNLIAHLPPRHAALLFAMAPLDYRHEVARTMAPELRVRTAEALLRSNRISREEMAQVFELLNAARTGAALPKIPAETPHAISDRGRPFDAAGALSVLLPQIDPESRSGLFAAALKRASGTFPNWYEDILYPDMVLNLPEDLRKDMLLQVDVRGLAGWSSLQSPAWQESFMKGLAPALQNAVRAGMSFGSRADQLRLAQQGHDELVAVLKKLAARGKVSFEELVA